MANEAKSESNVRLNGNDDKKQFTGASKVIKKMQTNQHSKDTKATTNRQQPQNQTEMNNKQPAVGNGRGILLAKQSHQSKLSSMKIVLTRLSKAEIAQYVGKAHSEPAK